MALATTACGAEIESPFGHVALETRPLDASRVALVEHGRTVAIVDVEHVDLDRVEAARGPRGRLAAVWHHGRFGGSTLLSRAASQQRWRSVLVSATDQSLSAPRFDAEGRVLVVVRDAPRMLTSGALRYRGELLAIDASGRRERLGDIDDAAEVLGLDQRGRVLLTRTTVGDLPARTLARLDISDGTLDVLARGDAVYAPTLGRDGALRYVPAAVRPELDAPPAPPALEDARVATLAGPAVPLGRTPSARSLLIGVVRVGGALPAAPRGLDQAVSPMSMPYIHQVYDTPDSFNGHWACGSTATLMAVQHFNRLDKWTTTVSVPSSHKSHYGNYIAKKYTFKGYTFNRAQGDASGKTAYGAYGHCTENGAAWAWRMQDYAKKHNLKSDFSGSSTFSKVQSLLAAGKIVVLSTQLTSAGHIITLRGTTSDGKLVVNDPYGNRNKPSYPNTAGARVTYTWAKVKAKWHITVHGTVTPPPAPAYRAEVKRIEAPTQLQPGESATVTVTLKNTGSKSWGAKTHLGTSKPRDRHSELADASWVSPSRPAAADKAAKPGETARFVFTIRAPDDCQARTIDETFGVVQEGVTWFSDSGGPGDGAIKLSVSIDVPPDCGQTPQPQPDPEPPAEPQPTTPTVPTAPAPAAPNAPDSPGGGEMRGGCSAAGPIADLGSALPLLLLVLFLVLRSALLSRREQSPLR